PRAPGAVPRGPGAARRRAAPEPRPGAPRARVLHVLSRELGARGLDPRARAGPRAGRSQAALMHARAAANSFSRARTNCLAAVMGPTFRALPRGIGGRGGGVGGGGQSRAGRVTSFFGTETYSIDHKGRIAVPASMRRAEGRHPPIRDFVLVAGFEGCLVLYGPREWERVERRLRRIPIGDLRGRAFLRSVLQDAAKVTVDAQGRITLPPALVTRAGLGKEAV